MFLSYKKETMSKTRPTPPYHLLNGSIPLNDVERQVARKDVEEIWDVQRNCWTWSLTKMRHSRRKIKYKIEEFKLFLELGMLIVFGIIAKISVVLAVRGSSESVLAQVKMFQFNVFVKICFVKMKNPFLDEPIRILMHFRTNQKIELALIWRQAL